MEIKQLRYFTQVAESGSFLKAASVLGVAQPTLSRQISRLERNLGTVLLARHVRGVELTEAGARLRDHADGILRAVDRALQDLDEVKTVPRGQIAVGVTPTVVELLIPPLTRAFRAQHPAVSIKVAEGLSGHIYEWLESGEIQLGLLYHAGEETDLVTEPLINEALYLVAPSDAAIARRTECGLTDLVGLPMIVPSRPHGLRRVVEAAAEREGVTLDLAIEVDSLVVTRDFILDGQGYALLPIAPVARDVENGRLTAIPVRPALSRTLFLASKAGAPLSLAARELARAIRVQAEQLVRAGRWPGGAL